MARKPRYERRNDFAAPIAFGVVVAAGAGYILFSKLLEWSPFLVTSIPCGLIISYAVLVAATKRLQLRDDQSADNFYYMGFIFTLVSLAISLYQYGSAGSLDNIVRNFGVAVASTITGITLRIIFNQMRRDPVEVEHYSRLELAEASNRVRRELDGLVLELSHFRRSNQQMLVEGFQEIRDQVARSADESLRASTTIAEQMLRATKGANEAVASELKASDVKAELDQTTKNLKRITSALARASDQIEKASGSLVSRLGKLSPDEDQLLVLLEKLDGSIRFLGQRINAQADETNPAESQEADDIERDIARILATDDQIAMKA